MLLTGCRTRLTLLLLLASLSTPAQDSDPASLVTVGHVTISGHEVPYRIRHLPVSSFPDLPMTVAAQLAQRGCLIPQTYQAHRPENVIQGSFQSPGSADWATLCSAQGMVSLLMFFGSAPDRPMILATASETQRLQSHPSDPTLGFNWGIDPASPQKIHEARIGMRPRPPRLDHDALADSVIDRKTVYHYFTKGAWTLIDSPD
jgi:hypothetical protein